MKSAYAEGTYKNLRIQLESFLLFSEYYKLEPFPVDVKTLYLYAQFLSRSFKSVQSVRNYLSAVKDTDSTAPKRGSVFIVLMTPDGAIWSRHQRAVLMR